MEYDDVSPIDLPPPIPTHLPTTGRLISRRTSFPYRRVRSGARYDTKQAFKAIRNNQRDFVSVSSRRPTSQLLRELPPKFV